MTTPRRRRQGALLGVVALGAVIAWSLPRAPLAGRLLEPAELTTLDWRMRSAAGAGHPERISLVLFDSASVSNWPYLVPFPRAVLARLIDAVSAAGADAIAVDVYLDRLYPELNSIDGGDTLLRDAIRNAGNVVLVARSERAGAVREVRGPDPYFADVAADVGVADLPNAYESVRDAVVAVRTADGLVPGVALSLYAALNGTGTMSLLEAATSQPNVPTLRGRVRVADGAVLAPLAFRGPASRTDRDDGAFRAYSASAILALGEHVPRAWFEGRAVLLGTGFHAEDRFRTPFLEHVDSDGGVRGWTYGSELHATALHGLLAGGVPFTLPGSIELAVLFGLAGLGALATFARGARVGAFAAAALLGGVALTAWWAYEAHAWHIPLVTPTLALMLSVGLSTAYVSGYEGRERRRIRAAFARYVSPEVVAELEADPSRLRLGGQRCATTILFADLVGFTRLSEGRDPEWLVRLLNRHLDAMAEVLIAAGGTLDKYVGDGVMALFGAPRPQADHAARACRAALAMQRRLAEMNREVAGEDWPVLGMRIGLNSGEPVVGNIGGRQRFDYTALGDAVNLAARLEPACKEYGVDIIISDATRAQAGAVVRTRELDVVTVPGREEPVRIHELIGTSDDAPDDRAAVCGEFAAGLAAYRRRDLELAQRRFAAVLAARPGDGPARLFLERCSRQGAAPLPEDWDAINRLALK